MMRELEAFPTVNVVPKHGPEFSSQSCWCSCNTDTCGCCHWTTSGLRFLVVVSVDSDTAAVAAVAEIVAVVGVQ